MKINIFPKKLFGVNLCRALKAVLIFTLVMLSVSVVCVWAMVAYQALDLIFGLGTGFFCAVGLLFLILIGVLIVSFISDIYNHLEDC